jgi:hypothetical protein
MTDDKVQLLVDEIEKLAEVYATDANGEFDLQKYLAFKDGVNMGFQIWAQALAKPIQQ